MNSNINLSFARGIPSHDFFEKAWASEPLTSVLKETNIPFALPMPDEDISLIAKNGEMVVGQCSTNRVVKYWNHVKQLNPTEQNVSTRLFVNIHQKAVEAEQSYLKEINESEENAFHSAGIAVLPEYRGNKVGLLMRAKQIEICRENNASTLFCETTNRFSAATLQTFGFTKIKEYPYSKLADDLDYAQLSNLDDSFTVWCLRIKSNAA